MLRAYIICYVRNMALFAWGLDEIFGYGRIVSREPMTTSEHWLIPRTQQCGRRLPVSWRSAAVMMTWKPADDSKGIAYGPSDRPSETFDFAQKGIQPR
jgi:hypothetical protein